MSPVISKKASSQSANISIPIPDDAEAVWTLGIPRASSGGDSINAWAAPEGELAVDVYATPSAVVVRSAMAGVRPENISISLHNDLLTIRGERLEEDIIGVDR